MTILERFRGIPNHVLGCTFYKGNKMGLYNDFKRDVLTTTYVTKDSVMLSFRCYLIGKGISPEDAIILEDAYFIRLRDCVFLAKTD